jgi:hypothetical protein
VTIALPLHEEEAMTELPLSTRIAYPEELAALRRVYDRICRENVLREGSPDAAELSARAMSLFRHTGEVFDEAAFYEVLRGKGR